MPITDQEVLAAVNEIIAARGVQEELASFDEQFITHPDWACTDFAGDLFRVLTRPPGRQYLSVPVQSNAPAGSYFHIVTTANHPWAHSFGVYFQQERVIVIQSFIDHGVNVFRPMTRSQFADGIRMLQQGDQACYPILFGVKPPGFIYLKPGPTVSLQVTEA